MSFWDYLTAGMGLVEKSENRSRRPRALSKKKSIDYSFDDKKISIFEPVDFPDVVRFVRSLNRGTPIIVNFGSLNPESAERGLDFVCGAVCALGGKLERIGDGIYFYAPKNVAVENYKKSKGKNNAY